MRETKLRKTFHSDNNPAYLPRSSADRYILPRPHILNDKTFTYLTGRSWAQRRVPSLLVMSGVGVETAEEVVDAKVCDDDADKGDGNIYEEIA